MLTSPVRRIAVIATIAVAACTATEVTGVASRRPTQTSQLVSAVNLIECPTTGTITSSALVTPLGGVVTAGGTTISVPVGAVLVPTTITVTVPASNLMEVDISVQGVSHFTFEQPVTVTLSYARCTRGNIDKSPVAVWYIDSSTKTPLSFMGGVDDKVARAVTFTTGHLSGYAIANRTDLDPPPVE